MKKIKNRIMNKKKLFGFIILLPLLLNACSLDNYDICAREWKYGEGFYIGDFPLFGKEGYKISNDTIFLSETSKAVIINTTKGFLITTSKIKIKALETGNIGIYYEIGKRKE